MDVSRYAAAFLILLFASAQAQTTSADLLTQPVLLPVGTIRLDQLIKEIHAQAHCTFSFDASRIRATAEVTIANKNNTLSDVLHILEVQLRVAFVRMEDHFVLKPLSLRLQNAGQLASTPKTNPPTVSVDQLPQKTVRQKTSVDPITAPPPMTADTKVSVDTTKNAIPHRDTATVARQPLLPQVRKYLSLPLDSNVVSAKWVTLKDTMGSKKPIKLPKKKSTVSPYLFGIGLASDEVIYTGAMVQGGWPALHGWLGYRSNFTVSFFTYGVGSSWKMNERWRMGVAALNSSGISRIFTFKPDSISPSHRVSASSSLFRLQVYAEKQLTKRMRLQLGVYYNALSTDYQVDSVSAPVDFLGARAYQRASGVRSLYTLTNSYYAGAPQSSQTWIGIQIALMFQIGANKK